MLNLNTQAKGTDIIEEKPFFTAIILGIVAALVSLIALYGCLYRKRVKSWLEEPLLGHSKRS